MQRFLSNMFDPSNKTLGIKPEVIFILIILLTSTILFRIVSLIQQ